MPIGSLPSIGDDVQVRVLGPVRLEVDGRQVRLGAQLRLALAVLTTAGGRPVSRTRLAELLWGHPIPAAADATLRSHVAHLRRAVEPRRPARQPPRIVLTEDHGYALRLAADQLDSARFEALLATGRQCLADDPARAAQLLGSALELWYGDPLADHADEPFAVAEVARLRTLRDTALRLRIDADLATGRHDQLLGELRSLVAADPTDEALRGRLALALYRCGRTDAAAQACADGLRQAHERGLDAPALRALQTDVLRGAAGLDWRPRTGGPRPPGPLDPPGPAGGVRTRSAGDHPNGHRRGPVRRGAARATGSRPSPPFQLPADIDEFTGRAAELAAVAEHLGHGGGTDGTDGSDRAGPGAGPEAGPDAGARGRGAAAVAVDGKPGVGKSALVAHLAHRLAPRFPDGVLYANLRGAQPHQLAPVDVLGRFLRALGVPDQQVPASLDAASAALRSVLATRRVLMVLDNAADAAQVRPLLPAGGRSAALITSRRPLVDLDAVRSYSLDLLHVDDAVTLLDRLAGAARVAADPGSARAVVRYCGLLPLAVRIAGARLRARPCWSVATLAARLADEQRRLAELAVGDLAVQASFQLSYQALDRADGRLFRLLGLLDGADVSVELAAALAGVPNAEAEQALERLVDAQLLETHVAGRYRFHDLLRLFARQCAEAQEGHQARRDAVSRALVWCVRGAERANGRLLRAPAQPRADEHAALGWLDLERANLVSAVRQAAAAAPDPVCGTAWRLNDLLARYFVIRRLWPDWTATGQAALTAATAMGDREAQGVAHRHLGTISSAQFRFAEADHHLRRALDLFRDCGRRDEEGLTLDKLGVLHGMRRQPAKAIDYCTAALALARETGDRRLESKALNNLGFAHCEQERLEEAAGLVRQSVAILRGIGERFELSTTLESLGEIHLKQQRHAEALACFEECLAIAVSYDDRFCEAMALRGIGLVTRRLRGRVAARPYLAQALAILAELGAPEAEGVELLFNDPRPAATG